MVHINYCDLTSYVVCDILLRKCNDATRRPCGENVFENKDNFVKFALIDMLTSLFIFCANKSQTNPWMYSNLCS